MQKSTKNTANGVKESNRQGFYNGYSSFGSLQITLNDMEETVWGTTP